MRTQTLAPLLLAALLTGCTNPSISAEQAPEEATPIVAELDDSAVTEADAAHDAATHAAVETGALVKTAAKTDQERDPDDLIGTRDPNLRPIGRFALWEDYEGGTVCNVDLIANRTIGGYDIAYDEACVNSLDIGGDIYAWFPADDGQIVFIDVTRKVLLRMRKDGPEDYYAVRKPLKENLNLTRPTVSR